MKLQRLSKNPGASGFFISTMFLFLFASCLPSKDDIRDRPVLQVGEETLSLKEFSDILARRLRNQPVIMIRDQKLVRQAKASIIDDYIVYLVTKKWAENNGLNLSSDYVEQEISKVRGTYPNDIAFRESLATENLSFNEWKKRFTRSLLEKRVFEKVASTVPNPSEAELRSHYEKNKKSYAQAPRILLRQLVLPKEASGAEILKRINRSNFADMAQKYSTAPEASKGGLLGWIEKGTLEVFDEAFALKPGRVSDVHKSPYGYHIFLVEKTDDGGLPSFEEARNRVQQELLLKQEQAAFSNWLDKQIKGTKIWKDETLIQAAKVELAEK